MPDVNNAYNPISAQVEAPLYVRGMQSIHYADEIYDIGFRSVARSMKRLDDAGVTINVGSHGQASGLAMHWEMQLLAEGGMAPMRILRAATLNGAHTLWLDHQLGSLEPGKLADLIVLDKDPLERHPQHQQRALHDGERPPVRRGEHERDRQLRSAAQQVLLGAQRSSRHRLESGMDRSSGGPDRTRRRQ